MSFATNVKAAMSRSGIRQNELARAAGLSSSGICTALSEGGNPRLQTIIAIAEALGCSVSELLGEKEATEPHGVRGVSTYEESIILQIFRQLNESGQNVLLKNARALLEESAFRKDDSIESAV